jgi:hypothetical protein
MINPVASSSAMQTNIPLAAQSSGILGKIKPTSKILATRLIKCNSANPGSKCSPPKPHSTQNGLHIQILGTKRKEELITCYGSSGSVIRVLLQKQNPQTVILHRHPHEWMSDEAAVIPQSQPYPPKASEMLNTLPGNIITV